MPGRRFSSFFTNSEELLYGDVISLTQNIGELTISLGISLTQNIGELTISLGIQTTCIATMEWFTIPTTAIWK
jgi:hypothetical protein